MARGHKTGSQLHRCHTPLTFEVLQVLLGDLQHRPTQPHHKAQRERRKTSTSSTTTFFVYQRIVSPFSLFLAVGKEAKKQRDIVQKDVCCTGVTKLAIKPHGSTTEEAKWLGPVGAVKRQSKNHFTRHPTVHTTRPIHHRMWQPYLKWVP
jgi:hypothetical protein